MTQQIPQTSFGSSILYEDRLPIKIETLMSEPASGELLRVGLLNDEVLRTVMSLDDAIVVSDKGDDNELQRLELKLNLVLDLVGELYAQSVSFPEIVPVKVGACTVFWMIGFDDEVPVVGSYVSCALYLTRRYPRPLVLLGRVVQTAPCETGESWVELALLAMPQQTQDNLERFVFRQHRRFVAFSRRK